ncbi:hypothetical protein JXA56_00535 [Candidatus Micrarchaeota archaeon]|nr:hypothetical protein [Candidatus Micrarchaeota archaeon]
MVNMTLSIPEDLYKKMMAHSELKWSDVARQAFEKKVRELHWMDEILKNSQISEEDAERIGHDVKARMRKRFSK